ncbi:Fc.00g104350.m01.CDS01 [Cosmosporella sp. VM-42]
MSDEFDPENVNLTTADPRQIVCFLNAGENDYDGRLGARVSAIFVILIVSSAATFFPVLATRSKRIRVPLYVYLFARYFGAGVIVATAFIHLLDPAYEEIGPASCVGMTGNWSVYSWPPAIVLTSVMAIFLMDFLAEYMVETKYGMGHDAAHRPDAQDIVTGGGNNDQSHRHLHSGDQDTADKRTSQGAAGDLTSNTKLSDVDSVTGSVDAERAFRQQISAFLILEFGVIFHSIIIGLNLGVISDEFSQLYPVLVFHQSFEGLGIGARLSAIPFPSRHRWMPWLLCLAYGLTTPISIAIGLGLRKTYNGSSFTANVVSGVLDSISAGILIYTGLVEMLARDFLFNPGRTRDKRRISFMLFALYLGALLMALIGKWA